MSSHTVTFYPLGNADTTLIKLANGQNVLIDYAHMRCDGDLTDKRIDLPVALNKAVTGDFDVVCFTHADKDHINRFSEYFHLEHAAIYQGAGRKRIKELWVPANILVETNLIDDARILRTEARYRLKQGRGIRVFSRPKKLKDWCDSLTDICFDDIKHLIVDAGKLAPGFTMEGNGVEFFVHSPFVSESLKINRNYESIVLHATFDDAFQTKLLLGSDINHDAWADIVDITKFYKNYHRLEWDLLHVSHHSSYTALGPDKGARETIPNEQVKWLIEEQGHSRSRIISPSWEITSKDDDQPPHQQAATYYRRISEGRQGGYFVTMEYPNRSQPKELTFEIDPLSGARLIVKDAARADFAAHSVTPRAGANE